MSDHFGDRLSAAMRKMSAPACVGLDPLRERLPAELQVSGEAGDRAVANAFHEFGRGIIAATAPYVPAIKINVAFFEPLHEEGLRVYRALIREAHTAGMVVIGDVKRADIGHTSGQYAAAHLRGAGGDEGDVADAITINPYFGSDGVAPFVDAAAGSGRGVFVLVQTSNESASQVQGLMLPDGLTVCQKVAQLVQGWAVGCRGRSGYSCVGAVVSPRDLESTILIRELMPDCIFLVPGFGAQGRTADEVAKCFKKDGSGAIVAASRSVIFAHLEAQYKTLPWRDAISAACRDFVCSLRQFSS